jgi:hypothetical protein
MEDLEDAFGELAIEGDAVSKPVSTKNKELTAKSRNTNGKEIYSQVAFLKVIDRPCVILILRNLGSGFLLGLAFLVASLVIRNVLHCAL